MTNLFEQASRLKLRFTMSKGVVSTEDLWDLRMEDLDTIAIALNKQIKDSSEVSFIKRRTTANKTLELAFEVVKYIIEVRIAEKEAKQASAERASKRAKLQELIDKKQESALEGKSIEELQAEMNALED
jgi:hypothetical protein